MAPEQGSTVCGATTADFSSSQYSPKEKLSLKLKIGDEEITQPGELFSEATFIVDVDQQQ